MKTKVSDLRKFYPDMAEADRDYPPLKFKSLKGKVSAAEWQARVDCACAYRLVRIFRMDDIVYNHISVHIPGTEAYLLLWVRLYGAFGSAELNVKVVR